MFPFNGNCFHAYRNTLHIKLEALLSFSFNSHSFNFFSFRYEFPLNSGIVAGEIQAEHLVYFTIMI